MKDVTQICHLQSVLEFLHYIIHTEIKIEARWQNINWIDSNNDSFDSWDKSTVICFNLTKFKLYKNVYKSLIPDICSILQAE